MDVLIQFWPIVLGFVALIVWLVRLEARVMDMRVSGDTASRSLVAAVTFDPA